MLSGKAGLRLWRHWRTENNEAPLQILKFQKIDFHLKFYTNITKAGTELQKLSKKYKNLPFLLFTNYNMVCNKCLDQKDLFLHLAELKASTTVENPTLEANDFQCSIEIGCSVSLEQI